MSIKNEHWKQKECMKKVEDWFKDRHPAVIPREEFDVCVESMKLEVLADICDNLTVIANILLNSSKGGK